MDYIALVGSRCYGLELDSSDHDYVISGNAEPPIDIRHCFVKTPDALLSDFLLHWTHPYALMPLFSSEIGGDQKLVSLVINSREQLVFSYRDRLYSVYMKMAQDFLRVGSNQSRYFAKLSAYGLLWLETLVRYANGESFFNAFRPSDDLKSFLMDLRQEKVTLKSLSAKKKEVLNKAKAAVSFYSSEEDLDTQKAFEEEFFKIAEVSK